MPIFQQSVDAELYEWLMREQKRRGARSIQDVIRQILLEAKWRLKNSMVSVRQLLVQAAADGLNLISFFKGCDD